MKLYNKLLDKDTNELKTINNISFDTNILTNYKNKLFDYSILINNLDKISSTIQILCNSL